MTTVLWLDDIRNPADAQWWGILPRGEVTWVKNYKEFVEYIQKSESLPDVISFDHDIGEEHYVDEKYWNDYYTSSRIQEDGDYREKTGYDCAKWLIDYCLANKLPLPDTRVHSMNPVGAEKIRELFLHYRRVYGY